MMSYDTLADLFVSGQKTGKASRMFIDGNEIYSYGYHFVVARRYPESGIIVVTSDYYSKSTARHVNTVRYALSKQKVPYWEATGARIDMVPYELKRRAEECAGRIMRSRSLGRLHMDYFESLKHSYREFYKRFGKPVDPEVKKALKITKELRIRMIEIELTR